MTMRVVAVAEASQVGQARRLAAEMAEQSGFNEEGTGRIAIVATELATNLIKHGGGGELLISRFDDRTGTGIECMALDSGPGMVNVDASLRDGHSTAGTTGTGLGAVVRGSHLVDIYSRPGGGTIVLARRYAGRADSNARLPTALSGVVCIPKRGEEVCGDDWCLRPRVGGVSFVVADGLGHGPDAAQASNAAVATFLAMPQRPVDQVLTQMHEDLSRTRGAAVLVGDLDLARGDVLVAGVGNIAGALVSSNTTRRMISHNGTIGLVAKRIQTFSYPVTGVPLVIVASDGLLTNWSLAAYPGITERHPAVIAGVLYRDFCNGRDDVTVLVIRADQL
jgi:anti-sigma regulatory factor (Ser/Thr protein kinase)